MAEGITYAWTGKYSSSSRNFTGFVRFTYEPNYSRTQARLRIHSMGVWLRSNSTCQWGTSSTNGPKYLQVSISGVSIASGTTPYKISRDSTNIEWGDNDHRAWNFVTNGWGSSQTAWDGNTARTFIINKTSTAQTLKITGHIYKKGAWAVNNDFSTTKTVPALTVPCYANVNGTWKDSIVRAKVNGAWVVPYAGYTKVNGTWKAI